MRLQVKIGALIKPDSGIVGFPNIPIPSKIVFPKTYIILIFILIFYHSDGKGKFHKRNKNTELGNIRREREKNKTK